MDLLKFPAEGRRLETPTRESLLQQYGEIENFSKSILAVECFLACAAAGFIAWKAETPFGIFPWIAFAIGSLGVFRWFAYHAALNKKRIDKIRPDARFGDHTRDSLVRLSENVFSRLGLRPGSVPVYLTRQKDVNASAVRCELWPGMHLFNGVFLNRSIIHLLDERELASVIGHELGHVVPYAPLLSRCYLVHSLFAGAVSFAVTAMFPHPGIAVFVPVVLLGILGYIIAYPHLRLSRGVEFLCDDYGAQAAGLLPALSAEMKIGVEAETRQDLFIRMLQARRQGLKCSLQDLVGAYEEAIPFGKADPETFEKEFKKIASEKQQTKRGVSLGGFLDHLQGDPDLDDENETVSAHLKTLEFETQLPVLRLDRTSFLRGSSFWNLNLAEGLVDTLQKEPQAVLLRLAHEVDDRDATHPNTSRRILFLWRNREAYRAN